MKLMQEGNLYESFMIRHLSKQETLLAMVRGVSFDYKKQIGAGIGWITEYARRTEKLLKILQCSIVHIDIGT
jgi:hypothetical protein